MRLNKGMILMTAFVGLHSPKFAPQDVLLDDMIARLGPDLATRNKISDAAAGLVRRIRASSDPTLMEEMLTEYGLSSAEGLALMSLAEAALRVPDAATADALIEDKIAGADWRSHGNAQSRLVRASSLGLALTGHVLDNGLGRAVHRVGAPVIRNAVRRAMKEMGRQFVLGETIEDALRRGRRDSAKGYRYSFDMLGEAAMTAADAARYQLAYTHAIKVLGQQEAAGSINAAHGISIKLSALFARYEFAQSDRVMAELVPVVRDLARLAARCKIALHIDAEEQDRLAMSLAVMEAVMADPETAGWDGFGAVVQAYGKRAEATIDALYDMATCHQRRLNIRLVKGAYWDAEIKLAQVGGMPDFAVLTTKTASDISYICLTAKLLGLGDRFYPQFATHNAHSVSAVLELAQGRPFEFQRLHGMGERLHEIVRRDNHTDCRIYAPVGAHRELLAYLVRRLLENGANSSFVHQIANEDVSPLDIARDPFAERSQAQENPAIRNPCDLFGPARRNSAGFDLNCAQTVQMLIAARPDDLPDAAPITVTTAASGAIVAVLNPATGARIAVARQATAAEAVKAIADARMWSAPAAERARVLRRAADLYEESFAGIFAALAAEAGKTMGDTVGELREAVDFLRYYAAEGQDLRRAPLGTVIAISPWNFPLAIFTGQIAAALMCGNAVIAKPAEQTPLIAAIAVRLLHLAGVPLDALQLVLGDGAGVGAALTADAGVGGVVFTGSTRTAQTIAVSMAAHMAPGTPFIAETGGLNAMIVDSTALPEQAVRDIVASAFRSAGQRCSALRCLYVQEDCAPAITEMLCGAMAELSIGDPRWLKTDIGPVIDAEAKAAIDGYVDARASRVICRGTAPKEGHFVAPTLIGVTSVADLEREVFGPVLHLATYKAADLPAVISQINATGYGLTFGLHSRIAGRAKDIANQMQVGNIYINRNQIGAAVGSQPFGGEGLSGTGPKAGGPLYLARLSRNAAVPSDAQTTAAFASDQAGPDQAGLDDAALADALQDAASDPAAPPEPVDLPGPTGETNRLTFYARDPVLCLGPGAGNTARQVARIRALGGRACAPKGLPTPGQLERAEGFSAVIWAGDDDTARDYARALATREGPIIALLTGDPDTGHVVHERHVCTDTTAAGGNAALLAG